MSIFLKNKSYHFREVYNGGRSLRIMDLKANKMRSQQIKTVFLKQWFASCGFLSDTDVFAVS